jgi:hypothetical protein
MKKLLIIWLTCAAAAFIIVKVAKIGPVIATISATYGWGVHTGDLLALVPAGIAAGASVHFFRSRNAK